ncbi:MAG: hypothetical protein L7S42_01635 [Flavobacteriaceae bacterium]|nr:hypothetical protein [Flavobacteriaceae bacterium]
MSTISQETVKRLDFTNVESNSPAKPPSGPYEPEPEPDKNEPGPSEPEPEPEPEPESLHGNKEVSYQHLNSHSLSSSMFRAKA